MFMLVFLSVSKENRYILSFVIGNILGNFFEMGFRLFRDRNKLF